jgi:serine/arginine repetitive matrix protein 2
MASLAPEPFKASQEAHRRFNLLDSGILLNDPTNPSQGSVCGMHALQSSESLHQEPTPVTYSHTGTPTVGGLLAVPPSKSGANTNQGFIALRAIHSVHSLARMGSWA